jgi:serine/threonine protein kinase
MRCPLPFRAPEAVITGSWDIEADIWSLGCTVRWKSVEIFSAWLICLQIFAMVVGYPPFDSFLFKEEELIGQWIATFGRLPEEWERHPMAEGSGTLPPETEFDSQANNANVSADSAEMETTDLSQWLHETYYGDDKPPYFTETDLLAISKVLLSLFRFRPSERPSARDIFLKPLPSSHSSAEHNEDGPWNR